MMTCPTIMRPTAFKSTAEANIYKYTYCKYEQLRSSGLSGPVEVVGVSGQDASQPYSLGVFLKGPDPGHAEFSWLALECLSNLSEEVVEVARNRSIWTFMVGLLPRELDPHKRIKMCKSETFLRNNRTNFPSTSFSFTSLQDSLCDIVHSYQIHA